MPSEFVHAVTKYNLVTWYLLPLIHLNKFSFGEGNFLESYVTPDGAVLIVEIVSTHLVPEKQYKTHWRFVGEVEGKPGTNAQLYFSMPPKWRPDFALFKAGKFSQFSDAAKRCITEYSGLPWGQRDATGATLDDARILALTRSPTLQREWEEDLNLPRGHLQGQELLDVPSERNYRTIE